MATARGHMWMGPRGYESWVPACSLSPDFSRISYSTSTGYLNGGAGVNSSKGSAKHYSMTWGARPRNEMRAITDFAGSTFDTQNGVNLIYFNDPMNYDTNLAPEHLGNPALAGEGAPGLFGWDSVPSVVATGSNQYRYPARTAVYRADRPSSKTYFPIPPGFTAWIGAHGSATGAAGVRITQALGALDGTSSLLTMLGITTPTLVNYSLDAGNGVTGFSIDFPETGLLRNYAVNPSFESDVANMGSFGGTGGVNSVSRVAANSSPYGSWSARATWTTATTASGTGGIHQIIPVKAGQTYSFGGRVKSSVSKTMQGAVAWKNAGGVTIGTQILGTTASVSSTAGWSTAPEVQVIGITAPKGAVSAHFAIQGQNTTWAVGNSIEVDAIHANIGSTLQPYNDGNSTGWQWTGAVNDSVSRQVADTLALTGIIIQMLPTGAAPTPGPYISGQGNAGCQFDKRPTETPYNAKVQDGQGGYGLVAMSANLIETGPWL